MTKLQDAIIWPDAEFAEASATAAMTHHELRAAVAADIRPVDLVIAGNAVRDVISPPESRSSFCYIPREASVQAELWVAGNGSVVRAAVVRNDKETRYHREMLAAQVQDKWGGIRGVRDRRTARIGRMALESSWLQVDIIDTDGPFDDERIASLRDMTVIRLDNREPKPAFTAITDGTANFDKDGITTYAALVTAQYQGLDISGRLDPKSLDLDSVAAEASSLIEHELTAIQTKAAGLLTALEVVRHGERVRPIQPQHQVY